MRRLILCAVVISALWSPVTSAQAVGAWSWTSVPQGYMALTTNQSGELLAQGCYSAQKCVWFIALADACEQGAQHPVLVNTDTGAAQFSIACLGPLPGGSLYRYAFTDFTSFDQTISAATSIGIALPLKQDRFTVVRFSLSGERQVVTAMERAAAASNRPATEVPNTRDEHL